MDEVNKTVWSCRKLHRTRALKGTSKLKLTECGITEKNRNQKSSCTPITGKNIQNGRQYTRFLENSPCMNKIL
jgi:hypothetical protein